MIVYAVFSGSYSDRGLDAIFSTKDKAEAYILRRKTYGALYDEVDDDPIEYELDEAKGVEVVYIEKTDGGFEIYRDYGWYEQDGDVQEGSEGVIIKVKYNADPNVVMKAAQDKYYAWKAQKHGV